MIVINKIVIYMCFHENLHGARLLGHPVERGPCVSFSQGAYTTLIRPCQVSRLHL